MPVVGPDLASGQKLFAADVLRPGPSVSLQLLGVSAQTV